MTLPPAQSIASATAQAPGCIEVDTIQLQVESSGNSTAFMSSRAWNSLVLRRVSNALQDGQSGSRTSMVGTPPGCGAMGIMMPASSAGLARVPHPFGPPAFGSATGIAARYTSVSTPTKAVPSTIPSRNRPMPLPSEPWLRTTAPSAKTAAAALEPYMPWQTLQMAPTFVTANQ